MAGMGIPYSMAASTEGSSSVGKKDMSAGGTVEKPQIHEDLRATDNSRLVELMQAIQRIARLQQDAARAQVEARQKMREVGFQREAVWLCDAAFMKEVQRFMAEEPFEKFAELRRLGDECQAARDGLGPLEQEGIEAEQQWEGQSWKLREAEESIYDDFINEFRLADSYPPPAMSVSSSTYGPYSDAESNDGEDVSDGVESHLFQTHSSVASSSSIHLRPSAEDIQTGLDVDASQVLLGLTYAPPGEEYLSEWDSDSGIGEIDCLSDNWNSNGVAGPPQSLPARADAVTERYPELSSNFGTRRSRINKWLLQTALLSHLEADLLVAHFDFENENRPSNWSQLVIAYWELDAAAIPHRQNLLPQKSTDRSPNQSYNPEALYHGNVRLSPADATPIAPKPHASTSVQIQLPDSSLMFHGRTGTTYTV